MRVKEPAMFPIGYKFIYRASKRKDVSTIVDILTTYNSKNEIVAVEYVTEHLFMGQMIRARHNQVGIQMSQKVD